MSRKDLAHLKAIFDNIKIDQFESVDMEKFKDRVHIAYKEVVGNEISKL